MPAKKQFLGTLCALGIIALSALIAVSTLRTGAAENDLTVMVVPSTYEAESDEIVIDLVDPVLNAADIIQTVATADDGVVIAFVVPDDDLEPITLGTLTVDYTDSFLALSGTTSLFGTSVSVLFALDWEDEESLDPEWVVAANVDSLHLSSLNAAWTLPGGIDPQVSDGYIAVASDDIAFPEELTAGAINDFFPEEISTDEDATVQTGVTLLGTLLVAGVIGNEATQALFGSTNQTVVLRGRFAAPLSLFNLDGEPGADESPIPTQVSLSAELPLEDAVGFPGYVSAVGDWELSLDIESEEGTEFEVSGSGGLQLVEEVVPPDGIVLDVAFSVSYSAETTTFELETTAEPIEDFLGTNITVEEGQFAATIVSGQPSSADFSLSGGLSIGDATGTAAIDIGIADGQIQTADLDFELEELNVGELLAWTTSRLDLGAVDVPDVLGDISVTTATLRMSFDFSEGMSMELEADAAVDFGPGIATASLALSVEEGSLEEIEVRVGIGDLNIGELTTLIAEELGINSAEIPGELDGITLESATLAMKAEFGNGASFELSAEAEISLGDITTFGSLTFTVVDNSLDSVDLLLELGDVNIGEVTSWVASQFGVSASDIPDELDDLELESASLRIGLDLNGGTSIEVAAAATVTYSGFAKDVTANFLLLVQSGGGSVDLTVGLGIDTSLTLNDVISMVDSGASLGDFGAIPLPDFAIGVSTSGIAWDSENMPPEVYEFFFDIYNCGADEEQCEGVQSRNNVPDGAFLVAGIDIPEPLVEPLEGLSGGFLNTDDPVVFKGTIGGLFGHGSLSIGLEILLPRIQPPAPVSDVIDQAELSVALNASADMSLTATLQGELTVWLPTVLEPTLGNEDHFQRTTFLVAVDLGLSLSGIEIVLTGAMVAGDGEDRAWDSPFGQEWISIGSLAIQVGIGVGTGASIDISLGMGGDIAVDLGDGQLDFRGSFEIEVQIRPGAPVSVAIVPKGFYLASDAGVDVADVIHLYNLFASDLPAAMGLDDFPDIAIPSGWEDFNVGIKDVKLSFALEDNARLCLFAGLRIKGDLYIGAPTDFVPEVADGQCEFGRTDNEPRDVTSGGSCGLGDNADNGCFAGLDIEVSTTGLRATAGLGAIDLGPVGLEETEFELFFAVDQQHLKLAGGVVVEGVAEGNVEIFIEPGGFAFLADMNLLAALFQARIQGEGGLELDDPTFSIQGEMQTSFGHEAVAAWRPIAQPIAAGLVVVHKFMTIMADPNLTISEMTTALLEMPDELEDVGYRGPAIDAAREISSEVRSIIRKVDRAGFSISFDEVFDHMLGGASIGFDGVEGEEVRECIIPGPTGCLKRVTVCLGIETQGGCWIIPPFNITIPDICDVVGIPGTGDCDLMRVRVWFQGMLEDAFRDITGLNFDDILGALDHAIGQFNERPVVFNLECAAFNFDVGGGEHAPGEDEFALRLWFVLMGFDIYLSLDWDFNDGVLTNLNRLRDDLLGAVFTGQTGDEFSCDLGTAIGVPEPDEQPPSNLEITSVSPDPVKEGEELTIEGSFSPGSAIASDVVNVIITWPDDEQTVLEDIGGNAASFTASKVIEDDLPSGMPSSRNDIIVVVKNESLGQTSTITSVIVENVPPVIDAGSIEITHEGEPVTEVDEGDEVTISGAFSDIGVRDSHRVSVDWGDGNTDSITVESDEDRVFSFDHAYLDGFYENGDSSVYDITIRVVDKDQGEDVHVEPLVVHNVDPVLLDESIEFYRVELDNEGRVTGREPIGTEEGLPVIEEGAGIEVYGQFTDPGLIDTHTVHVDWGDTNPSEFDREIGVWPGPDLEQPGLREFRVVYMYLDDDPIKGDLFGDLTVTIQVEDKDGDLSNEVTRTVRVRNVDPEVSLSLEQETILENETAVLTIDIVDPGILDTFEVEVDWGDGSEVETFSVDSHRWLSTEDNQDEVPDGVSTDLVDDLPVISVVRTHQYLDDDPTGQPWGDYVIEVHVEDDDTGEGDDDITIRVENTDPRPNFNSHPDFASASEVQYSDALDDATHSPDAAPLVVTLDNVAADTMWAETRYEFFDIFPEANLSPDRLPDGEETENGSIIADGLPDGLSMVPPHGRADGEIGVDDVEHCRPMTDDELDEAGLPGPRIACTWTVDGNAMTAPGHYIITFTVTDDDTGETEVDVHLVVHPEDAEATYIGPTVVSAPSLNDGYVDLELRATLRDITDFGNAEEHELWDPYEGDIATSVVTFFDADSGEALCETRDIGYVFEGDEQVGVASCVAEGLELPAGADERDIDVGIVLSGWYTNVRSETGPTTVTLLAPSRDFVAGDGHLDLTGGAGLYPPGMSTQLLANARWGPGNRSLEGQSWLRFTTGGQDFLVDVTGFETLGTTPGATRQEGHAQIEATATLRDITGGGQGVVVAEGLRLQIRITDIRNTADVAFALWDDSEDVRLLASSDWDEDHVPKQPLARGNIQIQVRR